MVKEQKLEELTGRAYTQKSNIAIVLDDIVYSAPGVSSGPISGGRSEISGNFDVTETKDLANVLRAGKLPASADIVQSEVVGPSLGQEAIDNGTTGDCIVISITLDACLLWKSRMVCKYRFSKLTFLLGF
jgi:preprotein translocase subunit SecD